ncbi:MAG: glycosyltransferase [Bacteroidota bacterium]|nr:glycosyltransferase [Bacteroidota bacterium]
MKRKLNTFPDNKLKVRHFQRKPRPGFSFSLEHIFDDVRKRLADKINFDIKICSYFNNGLFTKLYNIIEAGCRQSNGINHITGEVHYLNLLMRKKKVMLTVLDCGMMHRKTGLAKKFVQYLYLIWPIRCSNFVTSISQVTKDEILKYTGCKPEKIIVIPVAVDAIYQPDPKIFNAANPNILHIGIGPNKNLNRLIDALEGVQCHFTIIGKLTQAYIDLLDINTISYTNYYNLTQQEMVQRYKECDILSFVSTFEGFGMPIIEANSVERAVITSNISSMPEVAADAACLVDPYNVSEIKNGIKKIINNASYREALILKGKENKKRFDADTIANQYYDIYKKMSRNL